MAMACSPAVLRWLVIIRDADCPKATELNTPPQPALSPVKRESSPSTGSGRTGLGDSSLQRGKIPALHHFLTLLSVSFETQLARRERVRRRIMNVIMHNVLGLAVTLGTGGLILALALA